MRRAGKFKSLLVMSVVVLLAAEGRAVDASKLPPALTRPVDFVREVRPIFEAHCLKCHDANKQRGGLRLDDKESALKGGENYAPSIKPKNSAESPLIHFVAGAVEEMQMPPKGEPLSAEQIGLLRAWIDQGASWPESSGPSSP
jgi:mono/diheme cytochrome c family protein